MVGLSKMASNAHDAQHIRKHALLQVDETAWLLAPSQSSGMQSFLTNYMQLSGSLLTELRSQTDVPCCDFCE